MFCASIDLPTPFGSDEDDVGGVGEEVERHQRVDGGAVAALGPGPVEVAERLEAADMGGLQPALQAAAGALLSPPNSSSGATQASVATSVQCASRPCRLQRLGAVAQCVELSHRLRSLSWS